MNRLYIDGMISGDPVFKIEGRTVPHLVFRLCVRHKTSSGEMRSEYYRVNAWNKTAVWAQDKLQRGQVISVVGYLTQRNVVYSEGTLHNVEIVAEQFRFLKFPTVANGKPA